MQTSIGQPAGSAPGLFPAAWSGNTAAPNASSSSSTTDANSSSSADSSATITGNDFLQLLVTELQNQDPTADTDPNEYITQLVQVNSLEQLVEINQDLGSSSSTSGASGSIANSPAAPASAGVQASASQKGGTGDAQTGNLPVPASSSAAAQVANALQVPSPAISPADLRTSIHNRGIHTGVAGTTISTVR
ncbi:MAG: flagellar hook capping FlgD N-terminal domain-containing protein [Acidobacteriaceae bacterium]